MPIFNGQSNRPLEAEERSITARVEQRKQFAQRLRLPERLLAIYDEVKYYPHWVRNNPADVCPLITDLKVVNESFYEKVTIQFSLKSRRYSFFFDEHLAERFYARLTLSGVNGEVLLSCP